MRIIKIFFLIGLFVSITSCTEKSKYANMKIIAEKDIRYDKIVVDTIEVNLENTSFNGFSGVNNNELYFFDDFFCYYYSLDLDGLVKNRALGLGRARNEVPVKNPVGFSIFNNKAVVMDGAYHAFLFDNFKDMKMLDIKVEQDRESYTSSGAYTLLDEVFMRQNKTHCFYNIMGSALDPISQNDYYENANIIMKVDLQSGEAESVGYYPDTYTENYKKIRHLIKTYFDLDEKDNYHVTYQADSLIYVYDNKSKAKLAYGFKGLDMDLNYENPWPTEDNFGHAYVTDLADKGYYYWLEYVKDKNSIFRTYRKGSHTEYDGLQVYENGVLVADINVPGQFRVAGYIEPYFITHIIADEENETMKFYRFRLE